MKIKKADFFNTDYFCDFTYTKKGIRIEKQFVAFEITLRPGFQHVTVIEKQNLYGISYCTDVEDYMIEITKGIWEVKQNYK